MALTSTVLHGIAVPFIFMFSLPMFILGFFTTIAAFAVLALRVGLVYLEFGLSCLMQLVLGPKPSDIPESVKKRYSNAHEGWKTPEYNLTPSVSVGEYSGAYGTPGTGMQSGYWPSDYTGPHQRRSSYFATGAPRRGSSQRSLAANSQVNLRGAGSMGSITPIREGEVITEMTEMIPIPGDACVSPSLGIARDFEGIGGWRIDTGDEDDERRWTTMNSRLELRSPRSPLSAPLYNRHHPNYPYQQQQRSHSAGPVVAPAERVWHQMVLEHATAAALAAEQLEKDINISRDTRLARPAEQPPQPPQANSSRLRAKGPPVRAPTSLSLPDRNGYFEELSPKSTRRRTP